MKLVYCIRAIYNPGGMERVLLNKVTYLVSKLHWDITIVTTDQQCRPFFYSFPADIRVVDLGINYELDNTKNVFGKILGYLRKRKLHKKRLSDLLMSLHADVVISLYPSESSFIPSIQDGSRKVLELHFCKFFRLQYNRRGLLGIIDRLRTIQDENLVRKFDKFVVLTEEDKGYWGDLPNIEVIPNAALLSNVSYSTVTNHRVIAVGRLDFQKGFDRLIEAWYLIQKTDCFADWQLDIYGQGEWLARLQKMIDDKGLSQSAHIRKPTNAIYDEYAKSDLIVMTSNYEGFGMVLVEAMACGVPAVAFDCQCGPSDIIKHGENGFLAKNGDINALAQNMMTIMSDDALRSHMSVNARRVTETYSEEAVMAQWLRLFQSMKNHL